MLGAKAIELDVRGFVQEDYITGSDSIVLFYCFDHCLNLVEVDAGHIDWGWVYLLTIGDGFLASG